MSGSQARQATPGQVNYANRMLLLRGGIGPDGAYHSPALDIWQPLNPALNASVGPGSVLTFNLRNVGLIKRCFMRITATVTNSQGGAGTMTLTSLGLANLVSSVVFSDAGNNQRINTPGWHLTAISTAKRRNVFLAPYTITTPFGYGNNNTTINTAPASIAPAGTPAISAHFEIPFVKNDDDLRGLLIGDITNATYQVQVTLNPNMFVATGVDATQAMYQSSNTSLPTLTSIKLQVWQNYLDQIPRDLKTGAPYIPETDVGTGYLLNWSSSGLPVANVDNTAAFTNNRKFESVVYIFDNNGTLNVNGSDLNYTRLQSANLTNILDFDGTMSCVMDRNVLGDDFPAGMHYLDFRKRPIDTNQFGNMQLVINPSSVGGSGAFILYGWESFGVIGLVNTGGSIPSGGG